MRIGIVTFYRVPNYGAMLQAYALWKYLETRGHEVVFVRHPFLAPDRMSILNCCLSRSFRALKNKLKLRIRYPMTEFAASFPQTEACKRWGDLMQAGRECDAFVVGSDQMWNPLWSSREHLPLVMLDFAEKGKSRLAYAVSLGTKVWGENQNAAEASRLMNGFAAISVREESAIELVRNMTGRLDVVCLPDPTLLQTAEFYNKLFKSSPFSAPYVFKYFLDEWSSSSADEIALECVMNKLRIGRVESDRSLVGLGHPLCAILGVTDKVSVSKWLERMANSRFVITNSFHGTVFSILFHKPFISILLRGKMSGMNERVLSLLRRLDLADRAIYAEDLDKIRHMVARPISWQSVDCALATMRADADSFWEQVLK